MKVHGPLMSMEARGLIGERLVFSKRKSGQQARFQKAQKDKITVDRTIQRSFYNIAVGMWNGLTDEQKQVYRDRTKNEKMSGYNLFMKEKIELLQASYFRLISGVVVFGGFSTYNITLVFSEDVYCASTAGFSLFINGVLFSGLLVLNGYSDSSVFIDFESSELSESDIITISYNGNLGNIKTMPSLNPLASFSAFSIQNNF